jgi:hypothetical protein
MSAPRKLKTASFKELESQWQASEKMVEFGRSRSLQIMELDRLEIEDQTIKSSGGHGMAALVSSDGYALTAEHVIDREGSLGTLIDAKEKTTNSSHLLITRRHLSFTTHPADPSTPSETKDFGTYEGFVSYPEGQPLSEENLFLVFLGFHDVQPTKKPARVVKRFKNEDLALIKLPFHNKDFFELAPEITTEQPLFMPGNPFSVQSAPAAGNLFKAPDPQKTRQRLRTSIPMAAGDSGGPVLNAQGQLVGVASTGEVSPFKSLRYFLESKIARIDPAELKALIAEDRRQH